MIQLIKETTGLSQSRISQFLQTTRSAVGHAETKRRQLRNSEDAKLVTLYKAMTAYEEAGQFQLPEDCNESEAEIMNKQVDDLEFELGESRFRSMVLKKKLANIKKIYQKLLLNLKVQPAVLPTLNDDPENDYKKAWLKVITNDAMAIYSYNCIAKQSYIQLQLDLLDAEQKIIKEFLDKNRVEKGEGNIMQ